jgi:hypothetical protein
MESFLKEYLGLIYLGAICIAIVAVYLVASRPIKNRGDNRE